MAKKVLDVIEGRYSTGAGQADQAHKGRVTLLHCELTDAGAVEKLIAATRPDRDLRDFAEISGKRPSAASRPRFQAAVARKSMGNVFARIRVGSACVSSYCMLTCEHFRLLAFHGPAATRLAAKPHCG